jgi:hypothetical protein
MATRRPKSDQPLSAKQPGEDEDRGTATPRRPATIPPTPRERPSKKLDAPSSAAIASAGSTPPVTGLPAVSTAALPAKTAGSTSKRGLERRGAGGPRARGAARRRRRRGARRGRRRGQRPGRRRRPEQLLSLFAGQHAGHHRQRWLREGAGCAPPLPAGGWPAPAAHAGGGAGADQRGLRAPRPRRGQEAGGSQPPAGREDGLQIPARLGQRA